MIWQGDTDNASPNYSQRRSLYSVGGIPHTRIGGYLSEVGGGTDMYPYFLNLYNQVIDDDAPMTMDLSFGMNAPGAYFVQASVELTADITTTGNKIVFMLARYINDDYYSSVCGYWEMDFDLTTSGESNVYSATITGDPSWNLADLRAVVLVQTFAGNRQILQAAQTQSTELTAIFDANIRQGPPILGVQFYDYSMPQVDIIQWEWDFDSDGTVDSDLQYPYYEFDQPGSYDVTLTVHDAEGSDSVTMEDFIIVNSDASNVQGDIGGWWQPQYGPYIVTGDVTIEDDCSLLIDPGTEIILTPMCRLTVFGQLVAEGEEDNRIKFTAMEDSHWDGIDLRETAPGTRIRHCEISGAVQTALKLENSPVDVQYNVFKHNQPQTAAILDILNSDGALIEGNIFTGNLVGGTNGVINVSNCTVDFFNNVVVNNTGNITGAITVKNGGTLNAVNNTIAHNLCSGNQPSQIFIFQGTLEMRNCILTGDDETVIRPVQGTANVAYSLVSGGYEGEGNIDADPLFVMPSYDSGYNYDGLAADWTLSAESPCIDAGDPDPMYNDPEDPDNPGQPLFPAQGTLRCDMGAYGGNGNFPTDTEDKQIVPAPVAMGMEIFPNPFNPETSIRLQLPRAQGIVSLEIYNIRGQKVRTLIHDRMAHNNDVVVWKGCDDGGRPVSSGVYFSRLTFDGQTTVYKMALMK